MSRLGDGQLPLQRQDQVLWQYGHPVLAAFAATNEKLSALEVDVLDAQPKALQEAQTRAVEQGCDQPGRTAQRVKEGAYLTRRQHDRQALLLLGADHAVQPREIDAEHLLVEEEQGGLGLVLGRP